MRSEYDFAIMHGRKNPYFGGMAMSRLYDVGPGWWPLLDQKMPELERLLPDTDFSFKEKFGLCRVEFFLLTEDKGLLDKAWELAEEIQKASGHICECCGRPGTLRTGRRWVMTLCDRCAELDSKGRGQMADQTEREYLEGCLTDEDVLERLRAAEESIKAGRTKDAREAMARLRAKYMED